MKCMNCGAEIPEDQLICPGCGQEVQIVPDYNPLDDVLAAQVRGGVTQTLATAERRTDRIQRKTYDTGRNASGQVRSEQVRNEQRAARRRQAEKKRMMAKKRKMRRLLILLASLVLLIVIGVVCYLNSYTGQLKKGYRLLGEGAYKESAICFEKAIKKDSKRSAAYVGLSKLYIKEGDLDAGEQLFLDAIASQSTNVELYRAAIVFYVDTRQESKVTELLDDCSSEKVLTELADYLSDEPEFSLDEEKTYDEIQALELSGNGTAIYYTTDQTDPTTSSTKYTDVIKLDEGVTEVRAISVNKKGIPSKVVTKTYTVEFPIADAPSVTPATGQYEELRYIEVTVPDKYTAYYTTDGTNPDPQNNPSTQKYSGPIEMPEGSTIFTVVLADQNGRLSGMTKRNFERITSE